MTTSTGATGNRLNPNAPGSKSPRGSAVGEHGGATEPEVTKSPDLMTRALNRKLQLTGVVERGDQRGRLLGFPTANLNITGLEVEDGVWAGTIEIDPYSHGSNYLAAISVGRRPTYYPRGKRLLEANLIDFEGELYGLRIKAVLHAYIRPQRQFPDTYDLVMQLQNDIACVRAWGIGAGLLRPLNDSNHSDRALSRPHSGRRPYSISRKRPKRSPHDVDMMKKARAEKRLTAIREAVMQLKDFRSPLHEAVAEQTGIPLGYLRWAYPTTESLLAVASSHSHTYGLEDE
ncbi:riboflavin kinase [Arthrobacter sp. StoSoilB22]|uniref:riboflavin kinase n=1 Tax=Arthrobacter sp. StoSoilB22 TaxID=2830996 RepID=UPI001CC63104|nr:riboflavin kinase [Arthrobacter sp. StoSoilB22]